MPPVAFALVAVPVPVRRLFTYGVPDDLRDTIRRGDRVRVVFNRRRMVATVVELDAAPPDPGVVVKSIEGLADVEAPVGPDLLDLTRFVSDYYLCSWGEAIEAARPPERARARHAPRGPEPPAEVAAADVSAPELTVAQRSVFDRLVPALSRRVYAPFLLFGATGSGKTEVYLRAAERCLDAGRGVLLLVPEIGLTPLLVTRLAGRFPGRVGVLHSGLPARTRRQAWDAVREGRTRFVVGARSAVFAPIPDLGLVVVDEEHDSSYKQEETPRYNARDLAVVRARAARAMLVLGSATPSLESFQNARAGRYELLRLGGRVGSRPMARVDLVDMRREFRETGAHRALSRALVDALADCTARGEQALVLRNRRGWATALLCPACGERITCTRCAVAMTWHRGARRLRCHYCGRETARPPSCPTCGVADLRELGEGTERIEDALRDALPGVRIERMDRDTTQRRGAHEALLRRFDRGEIDVLVGTQMIAKGHDFPNVTLVGVLAADQTLGLPDFRAGERTFQLLTQVAGRAGRGSRPGRVVVQGFEPTHPVMVEAAAQDYEAFYAREILYRRALRYPPLSALVHILVTHIDAGNAWRWAERVATALREVGGGRLIIGGPGPAPIERLKGRHRQQILVRSAGRRRLVEAVEQALASVERDVPRRALVVDVDPVSLL